MPWCAECDRFLSPSTVTSTGHCPRCGASVDPGRARRPEPAPAADGVAAGAPAAASPAEPDAASDDDTLPLPWHFKLLVGAIVMYLGWRAYQGVEWVVHQL